MDPAMLFACFVLTLLFLVTVAVIVALGMLPGRIARARNHRYADAINAASWIGLALGGILWPFAFVWAFFPGDDEQSTENQQTAALRQQVDQLQAELASLKASNHPSA